MQKDRTKRLGAKEDFTEIKNHIFFPINWDDLINKKITPPFNPNVSGPSDLRHFDPEFMDEPSPALLASLQTASSSPPASKKLLRLFWASHMPHLWTPSCDQIDTSRAVFLSYHAADTAVLRASHSTVLPVKEFVLPSVTEEVSVSLVTSQERQAFLSCA